MKRGTPGNSKFRALGRKLQLPDYAVAGILELLWHLTARETPCGDIGRISDQRIADGVDWDRDPEEFVAALTATGWLDECETHRLVVHDWHEHADETLRKQMIRQGKKFVTGPVRAGSQAQTADNGGQRRTTADNGCLPEPEPCQSHAMPEPVPANPLPPAGSGGNDGVLADGTRKLTDEEAEAIDWAAESISIPLENVNPTQIRNIKRLFVSGCSVALWRQVVNEEARAGINSLNYFVKICEGRLKEIQSNTRQAPAGQPPIDDALAREIKTLEAKYQSDGKTVGLHIRAAAEHNLRWEQRMEESRIFKQQREAAAAAKALAAKGEVQ